MKKPVISIIIPVYNMERYLKQCIESIRQQTFKDWECIIVNDGSFDTTPTIIREETRGDARFKIINKENGGLSSARNVALKLAQGEYIGFIDSDDWIEPNMYEHLYNLITEHNADIAQVAYLKEYANGIIEGAPQEPIRVIDGLTAMVEMGYGKIPRFVWNKLHRKEIIDSDFPVGRNFEDYYVYGKWLKNVRKMVIDSTPMYHYRMRRSSLKNIQPAKNKYDYFLSCIDRMKMIEDSMSESMDINRRDAFLNQEAVNACRSIAREERNSMKRDGAISRIREGINNYTLPSRMYMDSKTWWYAKTLRQSSKLFCTAVRLSSKFHLEEAEDSSIFFD